MGARKGGTGSLGLAAAVAAAVLIGGVGGRWLAGGNRSEPPVDAVEVPEAVRAPRAPRREAEIAFSVEPEPGAKVSDFLPAGKDVIYATCEPAADVDVRRAAAGWSWNGGPVEEVALEDLGEGKAGGRLLRLGLKREGGFPPGVGEVEVHFLGRRAARGSFVVAVDASEIAAQQVPTAGRTAVTSVTTAASVDDKGRAGEEKRRFSGEQRVWLSFGYRGATKGAVFTVRWGREETGSAVVETPVTAEGEEGYGTAWLQAGEGKKLPEGAYVATVIYGTAGAALGKAGFEVVGAKGQEGAAAAPHGAAAK